RSPPDLIAPATAAPLSYRLSLHDALPICPFRRTLLPALYVVGVRSVPVVAITGMFIGMVLAVQSYGQFHQLGLQTHLGGIINVRSEEHTSELQSLTNPVCRLLLDIKNSSL